MRRQTAFTRLSVALTLVAILSSTPARAASTWDLIYTSDLDVTLCDGCGIGLAGAGFALLVNTGTSTLTVADLSTATFTVQASHPDFPLTPLLNSDNGVTVGSHEAVGSVIFVDEPITNANDVLLTQVGSGETFRNLSPLQFLAFQIFRASPTYEGPVLFEVTMEMGGRLAFFTIRTEQHLGLHHLTFLSAARVSSIPGSTPTRPTTWGSIKRLYR